MKHLHTDQAGALRHDYYSHIGDDNREKLTVHTTQDATPSIQAAKQYAQTKHKELKYKASIPANMVNEMAKICAHQWGMSVKDAFSELLNAKTDRAKKQWKIMTEGRDFRKLQAKNY